MESFAGLTQTLGGLALLATVVFGISNSKALFQAQTYGVGAGEGELVSRVEGASVEGLEAPPCEGGGSESPEESDSSPGEPGAASDMTKIESEM